MHSVMTNSVSGVELGVDLPLLTREAVQYMIQNNTLRFTSNAPLTDRQVAQALLSHSVGNARVLLYSGGCGGMVQLNDRRWMDCFAGHYIQYGSVSITFHRLVEPSKTTVRVTDSVMASAEQIAIGFASVDARLMVQDLRLSEIDRSQHGKACGNVWEAVVTASARRIPAAIMVHNVALPVSCVIECWRCQTLGHVGSYCPKRLRGTTKTSRTSTASKPKTRSIAVQTLPINTPPLPSPTSTLSGMSIDDASQAFLVEQRRQLEMLRSTTTSQCIQEEDTLSVATSTEDLTGQHTLTQSMTALERIYPADTPTPTAQPAITDTAAVQLHLDPQQQLTNILQLVHGILQVLEQVVVDQPTQGQLPPKSATSIATCSDHLSDIDRDASDAWSDVESRSMASEYSDRPHTPVNCPLSPTQSASVCSSQSAQL